MRAGRLNQRITFQRRTESINAYGEDVGSWSDLVTVWGGVEPVSGKEFFAALQVQSNVTVKIVCRYSSDTSGITTKDRISHGSNTYDIAAVLNVGSRNKELQFMCIEHSR